MSETSRLSDAAEKRLNQGLRGFWYPVAPSWMVRGDPVGITRLCENIALWRNGEGRVQAIEDRCPHRGARLSLGWNLGDRVACWYHGVEVTGSGVVASVPAIHNCPLEGQTAVASYACEERAGAIFLYFPLADEAPPPLVLPDELVDESYSHFLCTAHWKCNHRYAIDNVMDPMHGSYLHAASHSMADGDKQAEFRTRKTETGLVFEKTGQMGVNFDWVEYGETGGMWLRLSIPYRRQFGPGGPFTIVGYVTPVTEKTCRVFFWRIRKVSGWQRDVWRFLYRTKLETLHWTVLEQDRIVLEDMAPDARGREFLYQHDVGMSRVRRLMERKAAEQVRQAGE
jgi:phenylpropionate dioxygenase-like ring-hydroxylating dioxygenase large terminal subunit